MVPRRKISWKILLLAGFWLLVFIGTHLPKVPRALGRVSDKTMHFLAFGILAFLLSWVLHSRIKGFVNHALTVIAVIAVYAAIDEVLQIPVGRVCDFQDWLADMIGAIMGLALFHSGVALKRRYYIPGA